MKRFVIFFALLAATHVIPAQNQPPVVQNIQTSIDNPDELTIHYDLADNENDPVEITFRVSDQLLLYSNFLLLDFSRSNCAPF